MRRLVAAAGLAVALASLAPAIAFAQDDATPAASHEESGHGEHDGIAGVMRSTEFWGSVVNFALLVFILVRFGRKPIESYLASRKKAVEAGLAEGVRLTAEAKKKYDEYSSRLEALDAELDKLRAEMIKAGEAERDRIVAEAESKAARMRRDAEFLIQQQVKQIREDLQRTAVQAAIQAASEVLVRETNAEDQERLGRTYLDRIKERANAPADVQGGPRRGSA